MANKYFKGCKTEEHVKEMFFKWAKELHPDNGGDAKAFVKMKAEYEKAFDRLKGIHEAMDGTIYEKESNWTASSFASIIEKIIHFKDVKIEIIGSWIWVSGKGTFDYKDVLKELKFWYSKSKRAWYYSGDAYRKRKGMFSMKQLRKHWGSTEVETEEQELLAMA